MATDGSSRSRLHILEQPHQMVKFRRLGPEIVPCEFLCLAHACVEEAGRVLRLKLVLTWHKTESGVRQIEGRAGLMACGATVRPVTIRLETGACLKFFVQCYERDGLDKGDDWLRR